MRVTVLGSAASHAGEGQACAGHLVEGAGVAVLFDCGNGVLANLYRAADPLSIDAVFITHNHPDHYCDLYSLQAMLRYAPDGPVGPIPLYLPEGLFERMQCLLSPRGAAEFREAFVPTALQHEVPVAIGGMVVTPCLVEHTEPTFALRADADGARIAYTADTSPGEHALCAAAGADLLLAEATLPQRFAGMSPHLTAREAGELAAAAGARELVLVHVWPTNDRGVMEAEARAVFDGSVTVATELTTFHIS